jgi:two-component system response regulator FixJ
MNPQQPHIFVVDDDVAGRMALQRTLAGAGMSVSIFPRAEDCLAALSQQVCDAIIVDVRLDGMDGLSLLREVRRRFPWVQLLVATAYGDVSLVVEAMKMGAADFLEKPLDRTKLLSAINRAVEVARASGPFSAEPLSRAETRVLRLALQGRTCSEIGVALGRSPRTIEAHRRNIMRKLGLHTVADLTRYAIREGLTHLD